MMTGQLVERRRDGMSTHRRRQKTGGNEESTDCGKEESKNEDPQRRAENRWE